MKRPSLILGAGLSVATAIVPASAQVAPSQIVTNVAVRHDDLDLKSQAGVRAMLARLDLAATRACGGKPAPVMPGDYVGVAKKREHRRCKVAAMERSTLKLGSPLVRAAWLDQRMPSGARRPEPLG